MKQIYQIILIFTFGLLSATSPQISVHQSLISPRIHMFDEQVVETYHLTAINQNFHWQTQIDYRQELFNNFKLNSFIEYGSETDFNPNPFRIHNFYADYKYKNNQVKAGRIPIWNPFMMNTIDGLMASINLNKLGTLSVTSGFESEEIDTTLFSDKIFLSSWTLKTKKFNTALYYWYQNEKSFIGAFIRYPVYWGIHFVENFAWNLTDNHISYYRLNAYKNFSNHKFSINVRFKEINKTELYPWVENLAELWVSPTLSMGLTSNFNNVFSLQNVFGYRFTESENWFYKTAFNWKMLQTSMMYAKQGESHILSNSLAGRFRIDNNISIGGSLALNTTYFPGDLDQEQSLGSHFWLKYSISNNFSAQIFSRYYQNPYYKMDFRGGININYVF
ncbi:MAG: hypothetical protein ISR90_05290 [Candidatus Marinimicrobia bacterium]|nr:hypothetical protein [Candidatus Neomarinimicrobiota bacterium]MBL7023450.1 hypothetical protein [Candidatus Neomarinimicrobiota bacterium]MBL7108801.1 hypothetical protein [Candidatus Neomarinimicrobiota bacterium]